MKTKTIGKSDTNDVIISDPTVSRSHARVTLLDDNQVLVEDLNSLNGTYVNGYRIRKSTISLNDEVKVSEVKLNLSKIFNISEPPPEDKKDKLDYIKEFAALEKVWNDYQRNRIEITKKHNLKTSLIRGGFTLAPLVIFNLIKYTVEMTPEAMAAFSQQYLVFAILGSTLAVVATGNMSPQEKITQLDEDFKVRYVCPNKECSRQLGNVPWKTFQSPGKCPACKAVYF